ncbi:MAG TPA: DUF3095 family protein, partial [Pirellulales bacterium]|nr:DUF3095 family protein [Pirellulales bacterium]
MSRPWVETVPTLDHFAQVVDPARYVRLPDDWYVCVSDVIDSTGAIDSGLYKAVNLAGAATISAVSNALHGDLRLFVFGGDGARLAVPPEHAQVVADALSRVSMWAARDLNLTLRTGMITVAEVRAANVDVCVAFWRASDDVRYTMFSGKGMDWAEQELKAGSIFLTPADMDQEPDLTGLSCQWGPIRAKKGKILSLIVKQGTQASDASFGSIVSQIIAILDEKTSPNPVPADGPDVRWPSEAIALQSRIANAGSTIWRRRVSVVLNAAFAWLVFKLGIRIGRFDPKRYRREMAVNTDFRKFDDALMMTLDCSPDVVAQLENLLEAAAADGIVRFGLHLQDAALITC